MEQSRHHHINHSIFCKRTKSGFIDVLNSDHYLMGEYSEHTGIVTWQRLLTASQKDAIERWLAEKFLVAQPPKKPAQSHGKKQRRAAASAR
jgi:hypothetical protein